MDGAFHDLRRPPRTPAELRLIILCGLSPQRPLPACARDGLGAELWVGRGGEQARSKRRGREGAKEAAELGEAGNGTTTLGGGGASHAVRLRDEQKK
jgi:hypothetical protein